MDYSQAAYFQGGQPYHFIGMPPLTPSHSTSGPSEDFSTTSPPDVYTEFPNEQQYTTNFEGFAPNFPHGLSPEQQPPPRSQQQAPPHVFPGPPTPPNTHAMHAQAHAAQILSSAVSQPSQPHAVGGGVLPKEELLDEQQHMATDGRRGGSQSGEEGDKLTPTQHKRKAQNRAAQRAFRERKERHVKDLEAKLASLEAAQQHATTENERLKRDLQKISTENEILRATTSLSAGGSPGGGSGGSAAPLTTGPMVYNPTDFYSDLLSGHENKTLSHRIVRSDSGERLYSASATWNYIMSHDLYQSGLLDITDISNRLKGRAKCDGQGPVFEESAIEEAIQLSVCTGSDSLL